MKLFQPNIKQHGRLARALAALLVAGIAAATWPSSRLAAISGVLGAAFLAFEAARGWCALRACGIKTRI